MGTVYLILTFLLIFSFGFTFFVFWYVGKQEKDEDVEVFEELRNPFMMQIMVPKANEKTPLAAEQLFASLHGILRDRVKSLDLLSFEIASNMKNGIRFYVTIPQHLAKFVEGQIYAQYPNAEIFYVEDYTQQESDSEVFVTTGTIELTKDYIFPIKTFRDFEVDPLAAITGAMSELNLNEELWLQLVLRPVEDTWQDRSKDYIEAIKDGRDPFEDKTFFQKFLSDMAKALTKPKNPDKPAEKDIVKLAPGQDEELRQIAEKMVKPGFEVGICLVSKASTESRSEQLLLDVVASFKQFTTAHLNSFKQSGEEVSPQEVYENYINRFLPADGNDLLNIEELASVFHMPNESVKTPNIMWSRAKKAEPPLNLPVEGANEDVTVFAETDFRGYKTPFGLKRSDRRRHMYLLGKTGVGKSSTFKNMFISDVYHGDGACFIDPHGQDIEEVLDYIPEHRIEDVVYFNPTDTEYPVGFNLLELEDESQRDLVADGVVSVLKKEFGHSWGPRLQYILQNSIVTCLEAPGTTVLAIQRMLIDHNYRKFLLKHVSDPILLQFWQEEFSNMASNNRLVTEAVAPIQNKIGRFISSSIIRNILGQVKSTIKLREIMDQRKILLINLAQGKIGEESASLLGGMIITRLQAAAMERVDVPEDQRPDFFMYVDEFQNFATDSFAKILSEARKFRLNLVMTNQYIEQIPDTVRQAIFGNVGSLASFVVSQSDADILASEMAPVFDADDLVSLEAHSMYMKLCIDGMTSRPFSAKSINYSERLQKFGFGDKIKEMSREKYGMPKAEIEDKIKRWSEQKYSDKGNRSQN